MPFDTWCSVVLFCCCLQASQAEHYQSDSRGCHTPPARQRPGVAPLLHTMRKHLSNLRMLELVCKQNWQAASKVWQELGLFTQLTGLEVDFPDKQVSVTKAHCSAVLLQYSKRSMLLGGTRSWVGHAAGGVPSPLLSAHT
jgi:hypothetical protein